MVIYLFYGGKGIDSTLKLCMSPNIRARLQNKISFEEWRSRFISARTPECHTLHLVSVVPRSYNLIILKTSLG